MGDEIGVGRREGGIAAREGGIASDHGSTVSTHAGIVGDHGGIGRPVGVLLASRAGVHASNVAVRSLCGNVLASGAAVRSFGGALLAQDGNGARAPRSTLGAMQSPDDPRWRRQTRQSALMLMFVGAGLVALDVDALVHERRSVLALGLLFGPAMLILAAAGLVHPPLLYTFGPRRPHLTPKERRVGTTLVGVGVAIGAVVTLAWLMHR